MHEIPFYDPRLLPVEVVGFDVPLDQGLPCGQKVCTPLLEECLEAGTDSDQAVLSCARFMAATALKGQNEELLVRLASHEQLIQRLSVDRKTGILTLNASDALFNRLGDRGLLEKMREQGYIMQLTFGDLDKLKEHNALGDHFGGDVVIDAGAQKLRGLYRRNYDVVGILEYEEEARNALEGASSFSAVSRFDAGDELIVMSFLPPDEESRQRSVTPDDLSQEVRRITEAFEGLTVEYPLKRGVDVQEMHRKLSAEGFMFGLTAEGNVVAPVSMTFATVLSRIPRNQEEFETIKLAADAAMMVAKNQRQTIATRGTFSFLLDQD